MAPKANILIIHGFSVFPLRSTIRDLLYCYEKYLHNVNCFYVNLHSSFSLPHYLKLVKFDLIIFHTIFLSGKWNGADFFDKHILHKVLPLAKSSAVKVILPQDEWIHCELIVKFIKHINIDHVYSVAPPTEWQKIYKGVDFQKVKFHQVLTGYIDENVLRKIESLENTITDRPIDIGYRAFRSPPWLGKFGYLKTEIAEVFIKNAPKHGFKIDISTKSEDTILGDKWYEFMLSCKFFIGVEGGSTVLDPHGLIWQAGEAYVRENPSASYNDIAKNVFPGLENSLNLLVTSPRHLEACITKTAQVLIEGKYNGILQPGIHYIELKKDFSNLNEVFEKMRDEKNRTKMVERAYNDIALSGKYTYSQFVLDVVNTSLIDKKIKAKGVFTKIVYLYNKRQESKKWGQIEDLFSGKKSNKQLLREYFKYTFIPRWKGRIKKISTINNSI